MQGNKKNISGRVEREYLGMMPELIYISTVLCGFFQDQILPITGKYTTTAEIMSDTAKAFFRSFQKEIETVKYSKQEYHNILQEFAIEYVRQKYEVELKRFDDSVIGEELC